MGFKICERKFCRTRWLVNTLFGKNAAEYNLKETRALSLDFKCTLDIKKTSTSWHSPRDLACTVLALILGLVAGWLDMHVTEVVVTILALMTFGLLLGLIQPAAAWRWSLLIAVGLPIMAVGAIKFGMKTEEPPQLDPLIILVALGFALLGAYIGVFIRYIMRN